MIVTIVSVRVKPGTREAFIKATVRNHEASVREPGNMRFDLLQDEADPESFVLYEAYATKENASAHKETAHYLAWRDEVAGMMAEPRKGRPLSAIRPE
jgi:(4S)-4-hydroxy-5-phosphonooxypentane-2,3-dione isomerase